MMRPSIKLLFVVMSCVACYVGGWKSHQTVIETARESFESRHQRFSQTWQKVSGQFGASVVELAGEDLQVLRLRCEEHDYQSRIVVRLGMQKSLTDELAQQLKHEIVLLLPEVDQSQIVVQDAFRAELCF